MASKAAFNLGRKQVFLPNFTLTLLRTPQLPPTFASFIVPLNLNKLDLRDYLLNAYGITALGVRSYIQMPKVQQDKTHAKRPSQRRWFRPRSIKKMMVEMESPFVWPAEPENYEEWDKTTSDAAAKAQADSNDERRMGYPKPRTVRKPMAEEAKELLSGKKDWADDEWEEVEQDMKI